MWAQEGARHTSEMPSWRSRKVAEVALVVDLHWIETALSFTDVAFAWLSWRCLADLGWELGTLHSWAGNNRPGIDERTPGNWWQGKAGQGRGQRRALGRIFIAWLGLGWWVKKGGEGRGERFPNPFHLQFSFSRHFWMSTLHQIGWLFLHKTEELMLVGCNWSR